MIHSVDSETKILSTQNKKPTIGEFLDEQSAMHLASELALRGSGRVLSNPLVGAVLLSENGRLIGYGYHEFYGGPHAEVVAIDSIPASLQGELKGATLFVTLEPCAHEGKTPSCAKHLSKVGLKKVVYGQIDPNPKVKGKGIEILRCAGIACESAPAFQFLTYPLTDSFNFYHSQGKVFVGLKAATSLNGVLFNRNEARTIVTGPVAQAYGRYLRLRYDSIAVGVHTVIGDNPHLNYRNHDLNLEEVNQPYRIVFDPKAIGLLKHEPSQWNLLQANPQKTIWMISESAYLEHAPTFKKLEKKLQLQILPTQTEVNSKFKVEAILNQIQQMGIRSILVEGGSSTYQSFLISKTVQKLHLFQTPKIWQKENSVAWTQDFVIPFQLIRNLTIKPLDSDWVIEGYLND